MHLLHQRHYYNPVAIHTKHAPLGYSIYAQDDEVFISGSPPDIDDVLMTVAFESIPAASFMVVVREIV